MLISKQQRRGYLEDAKLFFMLTVASFDNSSLRDLAVWLIAISLVAFGFRYAKEIIAFILDEFYEYFVLKNPAAVE